MIAIAVAVSGLTSAAPTLVTGGSLAACDLSGRETIGSDVDPPVREGIRDVRRFAYARSCR
jgi:hypothetical protein